MFCFSSTCGGWCLPRTLSIVALRATARSLALISILATGTVSFAQESSVVIAQSGAPLEITKYKAAFDPETKSTAYSRGHLDRILHELTYKNISSKEIVALQIGMSSFNAFNGFMGSFSGWSTQRIGVGVETTGSWDQSPYAAFTFRGYGTGVAYVKAVRFADGTIWRANLAEVLVELQKFEKELKREDLADPKK